VFGMGPCWRQYGCRVIEVVIKKIPWFGGVALSLKVDEVSVCLTSNSYMGIRLLP
jgi:hypothetical protein